MNFIFGYAGIPGDVYDRIRNPERLNIAGTNCEFVSQPLKGGRLNYSRSHSNFFLDHFFSQLSNDHHNRLGDTGFALLYLVADKESTQKFEESFFPFIMTVPVEWQANRSSERGLRDSVKELERKLRVVTNETKAALRILKKEITEGESKSPFLLPVRNFDSKYLVGAIRELQARIIHEQNKEDVIRKVVSQFVNTHPLTVPSSSRYARKCFVDGRAIEFNPPGRDRHGFARGARDHTQTCFIAGRRRLGVAYDHAFHYDCIKGTGNLIGDFWGCHTPREREEGKPHLNISPNDFVR